MGVPKYLAAVLVSSLLTTGSVWAQAESPKNYLFKECDEDALLLQLDPGPFEEFVGPEFSLALEEGRARILIIVQDCSQYWIDGEDLGPTQHTHVWVAIEGVEGAEPVVGAQYTLPTATWFNLFAGSTNARGREARKASGTAPEPLGAVSLDPPAPQRGGGVSVRERLDISWRVSSAPPPFAMVGVNHNVYVRDAAGVIVLKKIQALGKLVAGPSGGTLEVTGETALAGLIAPGTYPIQVYTIFPIWARATLGAESRE